MEHEKDPIPGKEWKPPSLVSIAQDFSGSRSWQTPIADEPTLEPAGARGLLLFSTAEGASLGSPIVGGISLASLSAGQPSLGSPVAEGVSLDSLIAKHQKYTDAWRTSSAYSECRELLINTVLKQKNIRITQCMCLCLGSLSTQQTVGRGKKKYSHSMSQLVAFEGWVESLSMCQNQSCISLKGTITHDRQRRNTISPRSFSKTLRLMPLTKNSSHRAATQCSILRSRTTICPRQLSSLLTRVTGT